MKQTLFLIAIVASLPVFALDPGGKKLLSYTLWKSVSREELQKKMRESHVPVALLKAKYDVDIYDITYKSCWHDSSCILASGLVFVPRNINTPMPEVIYHHGTRIQKGRENKLDGESYLCLGLA